MKPNMLARRIVFSGIVLAAMASVAAGQRAPLRYDHENISVSSGAFDGDTADRIAFVHVFAQPRAPWMRLHLSDANLGHGSFIVLRSMHDNGEQRLNATTLEQWQYASAIFNGDRVMLELHVAPGDTNVFVNFDQVIYGDPPPPAGGGDDGGIASLCGGDDRTASNDNRVGRILGGGCTASRSTAGVYMTAGHCVDFDPDQGGPGLPDGVLDLSGVIEFNVPASNANGTLNFADPDDQYAIENNIAWQFAGASSSVNSVGRDWGLFTVAPNSNTGLMPEQAYGTPFRITRETPALNATLRVTGFGVDDGADNKTNQTSTGPFISEDVVNSNEVVINHRVDTQPANSGSPIIWEAQNLVIGIHTNAGCTSSGGTNAGTSFEHDALESWIGTVAAARWGVSGLNIRFVDLNHPLRVADSGTPYRPYSSVALGASQAPNGGLLSIVAGTYSAASNAGTYGTGNKAMIWVAPAGTVTIGQ